AGPRGVLAGPMARAVPASARAKTRLRTVRRWLEGLGEGSEARYLRWVGLFDEPGRAALYSDAWLEALAGAAAARPAEADPATLLARGLAAAPRRDPVTRVMIADLLTYLPGDLLVKVDLASMAHSLECRGPFLDHRVLELALAMPIGRKLRLRPGR